METFGPVLRGRDFPFYGAGKGGEDGFGFARYGIELRQAAPESRLAEGVFRAFERVRTLCAGIFAHIADADLTRAAADVPFGATPDPGFANGQARTPFALRTLGAAHGRRAAEDRALASRRVLFGRIRSCVFGRNVFRRIRGRVGFVHAKAHSVDALQSVFAIRRTATTCRWRVSAIACDEEKAKERRQETLHASSIPKVGRSVLRPLALYSSSPAVRASSSASSAAAAI